LLCSKTRSGQVTDEIIGRDFDMEISEITHSLKKLTNKAQFYYSNEAEAIINYSVKDKRRIEALLDLILDFCFDKDMLLIYKRLVRYYYCIDEKAAIFYINAYRELYYE
jgi:hypothetical protein